MANCAKRSQWGAADAEKLFSFRGGTNSGVNENDEE
jgi:hypothetical protein